MNAIIRQHTLVPTVAAMGCAIALAISTTRGAAEETVPPTADAEAVQAFVSEATFLVVKLDIARVGLPDIAATLKSLPADTGEAYQRWAKQTGQRLAWLRMTYGEQVVYATVSIPLAKSQWPVFVFLKPTPTVSAESLRANLNLPQLEQVCARDNYLVLSPLQTANVAKLLDISPASPRAELPTAFEAVASYPIQVLLLPPGYARRTVQDLMPELPPQLGGGPSDVLTNGLTWAALGVDTSQVRAELIVQSASEDSARKLAEHLPRMLQSLYENLHTIQKTLQPETAKKLFGLITPQVAGSRITVRLDGLAGTAESAQLLAMAGEAIRVKMAQSPNGGRFKQIILAIHNFHDAFKSFPPGDQFRDAQGNSKLSWRVHILPFLNQGALYKEFHLDEAWDSPHNKALLDKMPDVYKCGAVEPAAGQGVQPGYTTFLAPVGDGTAFGGVKATRFRDFRDGTSNTVVLVEVKPELAVPWTAPQDYAFDPQEPASGLRIWPNNRILAASAFGHIHELRGDLNAAQLLRLFRKADGEPVYWDEIK